MAKPRPWTVATHRPLDRLADGLWQVEADLDVLPIGRRMTIVKLANGDLVLHNVIALAEPAMAELEALGPVKWIIVPSAFHRMDAHAYATRYPNAKVIAPEGSAGKVAETVKLDGTLAELPADDTLRWEPLDGVPAEAVLVHAGTTLVFNDAVMNLPRKLPGFKGFVVKLMGSTGGPKVTRTAKFFIVKDRPAFAAHLRRLAERPDLARVIVSHGDILTTTSAEALARAAETL